LKELWQLAKHRTLHPDRDSRQRLQRRLLNSLAVDDWKEAKRVVDRLLEVIAASPAVAVEMAQKLPVLKKMRRDLEIGLALQCGLTP
jgi:hypothetical protein